MHTSRLGAKNGIIAINIAVFLFMAVMQTFGNTFLSSGFYKYESLLEFNPIGAIYRPWSFFTYMWIHYNIFHLASNMILLYIFGSLFEREYIDSKLIYIFMISGLLASIVYYLIVLINPIYCISMLDKPIVGSSAGIIAIIFAYSFSTKKNKIISLYKLRVGIRYIAITILLIMIIYNLNNIAGHIVHIIGVLVGLYYALLENRKQERIQTKNAINSGINSKVRRSGYNSLSSEEKQILIDSSRKTQ